MSRLRVPRHFPRFKPFRTEPQLLNLICHHLTHNQITAIQSLSLPFSDDLLISVFTKLRHHPVPCLNFFKLSLKHPYYTPSPLPFCRIVHILSKARMFDLTRAYLDDLVDLCGNGDMGIVVWGELVRVYGEWKFSATVFDMVIRVFVKKGCLRAALHVFDEMCEMGRRPSLGSCNALLCGLVRKREFCDVFSVFDQMGRFGIGRDLYTCTIMVDAYCKSRRVDKGLSFLDEMRDLGFEPSVVTYHCLINGYVEMGDLKGVERVLELMERRGIEMNVVTYTLLIKSYCRLGKVSEAEKVLQAMKEREILSVDEHAYGVLIDGYCRCGITDDALRIADEMMGSGMKMSLLICNLIINGYCKLGRVHEAEAFVVKNMYRWKLKPDIYSYNTLVDGFCRIGLTNEAFRICDKMMVDSMKPSVVTYNTLLKGFCREGAFDDSLRLWHLMLKRGVTLNERSYDIMLNALFKMNNFESAMLLWKNVLARGFATKVVFGTMLNGLRNMGKVEEAEEVLEKMKQL